MIKLENIKKYYKMGDTTVKALDDINLTIDNGEFVSIIGPSGSGKSTLMNLMGCLDRPTSGKYSIDDIDVCSLSDKKLAFLRNKKIGFIFQGFNLLKNLTAYENVELPLIYQGIPSKERKNIVLSSLEQVGMADRIKHKPNELSGGQQQRVAIARALATNPMCILADEPTGNLDVATGNEIMNILRNLNENGTTVVIITHNIDIAKTSKRIVHILDGRIASDELNNANVISETENCLKNTNENNDENSVSDEHNDSLNTENLGIYDDNLKNIQENNQSDNSNNVTVSEPSILSEGLHLSNGHKIRIKSKKSKKTKEID